MKNKILYHCFVVLILLSSCSRSTLIVQKNTLRIPAANSNTILIPGPAEFPVITQDKGELAAALKLELKKIAKNVSEQDFKIITDNIYHYLIFLGLTASDFKKAQVLNNLPLNDDSAITQKIEKPAKAINEDTDGDEEKDDKTPSNLKAIQRLLIASTQFLECPDLRDWKCLEKTPRLKPRADFRVDSKQDLGTPLLAGDSLDMDVFFTEAWDGSSKSGVADRFAEKLENDVGKSLSIAMYGIDDIKGSMSRVYNTIAKHAATSSVDVRAVVDVSGFEHGLTPWTFSYVTPEASDPNFTNWLFGESKNTPGGMHATFQYNGTPDFIRLMNENIKSEDESRVRIEWATSHIMHNKYAVIEDHNGQKSVWTGTANISKNCMGTEANSNMSIYVRNNYIAQSFLDEFNLMFNFDPKLNMKSKLVSSLDINTPAQIGRFHRNKFPVSHRFFTFKDGTNLRVHFAPTDDAEHRVILPMLLSAKEGDEIRIAMFGGTGYEIVRAMQYAAAKGAKIRIAYDSKLGHGLTSWTRDRILNVNMKNPYLNKVLPKPSKRGSISVRISTWKGKNHYKAGTLTRKLSNGKMQAEEIILGSQNWSAGGNDSNDENLISIQNLENDVPAAKMFNKEFDNRLWKKSREERSSL